MKHRRLRIAWSVACGIAATLLFALWIQSFWWWHSAHFNFSLEKSLTVWTENGVTAIEYLDVPNVWPDNAIIDRWRFKSYPPRSLQSDSPMRVTSSRLFLNCSPSGVMIGFPPYVAAIVFVAMAAAPWIHWSQRFSLRALLIATTLAALALGMIVWLR